ncbi:MAG: hypothetical protein ACE5GK_08585 [Nitrospiria bacterium]
MRIFHYCHDSEGQGPIQHAIDIAEQIAADLPSATQLLVTGSSQPKRFKLPKKLDLIKLPKMDERHDHPSTDPLLPAGVVKALREMIILDAIKHFKPNVIFVKAPEGFEGETSVPLSKIRKMLPKIKLVLGGDSVPNDTMLLRDALLAGKMFTPSHASNALTKAA